MADVDNEWSVLVMLDRYIKGADLADEIRRSERHSVERRKLWEKAANFLYVKGEDRASAAAHGFADGR